MQRRAKMSGISATHTPDAINWMEEQYIQVLH